MKFLEAKYPMGTIPGQRTAGRYMDGLLYENLKILAKNITRDMTYLGVLYTSTLEVGSGKSTFAQQILEAYFDLVNQCHGTKLDISMDNIVFKPDDLIARAFKVPRYSGVILDEWEDAHFWSKLGITLRQFFRKCRQLNLFIIVIIPNFFELPMTYAISRSVFAIDCRFEGEFERGYFSFYNFERKKQLYIGGKKTQNYRAAGANFSGRFLEGYAVDEKAYRTAKMKDMEDSEKKQDPIETAKQIEMKIWTKLKKNLVDTGKLTQKSLAEGFEISKSSSLSWNKKARDKSGGLEEQNDNDILTKEVNEQSETSEQIP